MKNPVNPRIPGFLIEFDTQKVESEAIECVISYYILLLINTSITP